MSADDVSSEVVIKRSRASAVWSKWWPVLLDGHDIGRLANGESLAFRAAPGPHAVVVGPTSAAGTRSAPFQFQARAGERIELVTQAMSSAPITMRAMRLTREQVQTSAAEIAIEREAIYSGSWVSWQVLLDGHDVGRLANGESLAFRAAPGPHAVVVGPTSAARTRSAPFRFHARAGERIELVTGYTQTLSVWCSAVSAVLQEGTGVEVTVAEGLRYEVPLGDEVRIMDNSKSASATTRVVRLAREWTRTSAVDVERATSIGGSAEVNLHILDLKAQAERTLTEKYSLTIDEHKTFEEEVTLNVASRTRCRIIFSWKEIRQKGTVQLTSGGSQVRIPYEIITGITFDQQQIDD